MREIKFRFWGGRDKGMGLSGEPFMAGPQTLQDINVGGYHGDDLDPEEWATMQYTGLKDKNGKDIYENDIVHIGGKKGEIVWDSDCYIWKHGEDYYAVRNICDTGEVVGNIHENPELLKGAE